MSSSQPLATLTTLPREVQQRVYDGVDLGGLAASARVSRAWLRSVRENSIFPSLQRLRLWPTASLRKLAVHLTWQSVVQVPVTQLLPPPPKKTGISAPLLFLEGLTAWVTHDNEQEAGLQLLEHVRQLVSVGGDGNIEWTTPATLLQREWMTGVSVLPAVMRTLHFANQALNTPRVTHIRINFSLLQSPDYQFFLKLEFERTQQRCSLAIMCRKRDTTNLKSKELMNVLLNSDGTGLHLIPDATVGYDPQTSMYVLRPELVRPTMITTTDVERIVTKAFLNGACLLVSFVYAPAAQRLQQQIDSMEYINRANYWGVCYAAHLHVSHANSASTRCPETCL